MSIGLYATPVRASQGPGFADRAAGSLGNTGNRSSTLFEKAIFARTERFKLRLRMQKYADRTMVNSIGWDRVSRGGEAIFNMVEQTAFPRDDRFIACGMRSRRVDGSVGIKYDSEAVSAGFADLQSCASVHSCPVCAAKIQASRAGDLSHVLRWAHDQLHTIAMVTLTVQHSASMPLVSTEETIDEQGTFIDAVPGVWDAVSAGWAAVTSGRQWVSETHEAFEERLGNWEMRLALALEGKGRMPRGGKDRSGRPTRRIGDQERYGILGWVRVVEVTYGANGWHVHVHALLVLEGQSDLATVNAFRAGNSMWNRWETGISSVGFKAKKEAYNRKTGAMESAGLDIRVGRAAAKRLAEYLTKDGLGDDDEHIRNSFYADTNSVAMEATLSNKKTGRAGGKTPFQILQAIDDQAWDFPPSDPRRKETARWLARWREWVRGSEGRRVMTWSAGLRAMAKLADVERDAQDIVDEAPGGELLFVLPRDTWKAIRRESYIVLDLLEMAGVEAVCAYFEERELAYSFVGADEMT